MQNERLLKSLNFILKNRTSLISMLSFVAGAVAMLGMQVFLPQFDLRSGNWSQFGEETTMEASDLQESPEIDENSSPEESATASAIVDIADSAPESNGEKPAPFWESQQAAAIWGGMKFFEIDIDPENPPMITNNTTDQILSDFKGRISPEFEIPEAIFNQTKFWFRIYTEFDSNKKVIHDALHPHIIYDVVDVSDILAQPARAKWLNVVKAQKAVQKRVAQIRSQLLKMANKKKEKMSPEELGWMAQFEGIKGNQKKIILTATQNLRVQTGQKNFFENGLATSGRYLTGMEEIFKQKGLPAELTRLPFVESSFVIGATSKVGAAGIWQFMPNIGRKFMTVNDQYDERRNPWKATEAAARLLKENYIILHKNWGLALTAYNHGPGGVRRAMEVTGSRDIAKIVRTYRSKNFDFASANFFTCFLAALHAQMYRDVLWPNHPTEPNLDFDSMKLKRAYRPRQLVEATGLSAEQILLYNPELDRTFRRNEVIPKGFRVLVPAAISVAMQKTLAAN